MVWALKMDGRWPLAKKGQISYCRGSPEERKAFIFMVVGDYKDISGQGGKLA